jgi:hypothetical protein
MGRQSIAARAGAFGFFVGHPNSERSQQDGADEDECSEYRQDIQLQGNVHERPPSLLSMAQG